MAREIELKFEVEPAAREQLLDCGVLDGSEPRSAAQETIYFDTPSGLVRRHGFSLRVRRSGERWVQTIKYRTANPAALFSRDEWETDVESFSLDFAAVDKTPLGELLTARTRKSLVPAVRTVFTRTSWRVQRGGGRIDVTLDDGIIAAGRIEAPVLELELELAKGDTGALFELTDQLSRHLPLRLGVLSKAERGFALASGRLDKASKAEPVIVGPDMSIVGAFITVAHSCLRHFRLNEPLILERRDPLALHQARVAIRRLRSAIALFRPAVRDWELSRIRTELRWLAGRLGEARNLDVLLARLPAKGSKKARTSLSRDRETAYRRAIDGLDSQRFRRLMLSLIRWVETGGWRARPKVARPLGPFAAEQLGRRWRKIRRAGAEIRAMSPERRHRLRLDIKKMRYSAEFLEGMYDGESNERSGRFIEGLERLQDRLGELNDFETARDILSGMERASSGLSKKLSGTREEEERALLAAEGAYSDLVAAAEYWR